ncbi:vacuolar protein sorting-associated protein 37B-like protein [Leptotrombidium deliense]|uniref:Vacuolar protein sorting-associated protein 37B-like protein n=1 Tax=Leptotrombidium deliense TaxID=299467 RepID=A0A443SLE3_9ACAR|nr:vacuolar protein sorting-associated protein 37B-like protein [Leptotrombidium deliense]
MSYFCAEDSSVSQCLQHFSNDELKNILNDEHSGTKLDELVANLSQVKKLESEREMLIASNKSLAEYNISREPSYRQLRQSLVSSHKEATDLKKEVEAKKEKLEEINRQTSLDTTLALLQTASAEAEEESETISNKFLSSDLTLDAFLTNFLDKRKLSHLRRIKTEKLMEYVRKNCVSSQVYPMRPAPPPPSSYSMNRNAMPPYPVLTNQVPLGYPSNTDLQQNHFPFSRPNYR